MNAYFREVRKIGAILKSIFVDVLAIQPEKGNAIFFRPLLIIFAFLIFMVYASIGIFHLLFVYPFLKLIREDNCSVNSDSATTIKTTC